MTYSTFENELAYDSTPTVAVESTSTNQCQVLYTPVGTITPSVIAFCDAIDPASTPRYVAVDPAEGAKPLECHYNVLRQVARYGGTIVSGWQIEEQDNIQLTANFHSVWCSETGLIDITPHLPGDQRIIFLPDTNRSFEGKYVPSLQVSLHPEDCDIARMMELQNRITPEYMKRNMKWHPLAGPTAVTPEGILYSIEVSQLNALLTLRYGDPSLHEGARQELRRLDLDERKLRRRFGLDERFRRTRTHNHAPNLKEPCSCGSGRKYKNCCRKIGK